MTEVRALIERLEKLTEPDREMDCLIAVECGGFILEYEKWRGARYVRIEADGTHNHPGQAGDMLVPRFTASIDAAVALVGRVLPGWKWGVHFHNKNPSLRRGYVVEASPFRPMPLFGDSPCPAIALVLATLRAIEASRPLSETER